MGELFALGFPVALALKCLGLTLAGALAGMVLGAMLGIGPGVALLLAPVLIGGDVSGALATLAGLYYGAQYGRSASAILFGVPGGPTSVVTVIEGHAMAEQGRSEAALCATLLSGFFACTLATLFVSMLAGPLSDVALLLGPAEMCAFFLFSLALAVAFAGEDLLKTLAMVLFGLALAYLSVRLQDAAAGVSGAGFMENGLNAYAVVVGLVGLSAAFARIASGGTSAGQTQTADLPPPLKGDLGQAIKPGIRGSIVGTVLGLLPAGGLIAPFCAYRLERWLAKDAARFGAGAIEGVAAPEAANNGAAQAALLPMLTIGLQHNAVLALATGTLVLAKAPPGPNIATSAPSLYWGTIAAFWIASLVVLVLGLVTLKIWPGLLRLPRAGVLVGLVLLGCLWTFTIGNSIADVVLALAMGAIGWMLAKRGFEPVPAVIGFLLGQQIEAQLEHALMISRGSYWALLQRPIPATLVAMGLLVMIVAVLRTSVISRKRANA